MRVLSATKDRAEWDAIVRTLSVQDVHFTSAYARVQEKAGGVALLLVGEYYSGIVAQPFLMQDIGNGRFCDFRSLYGFGGPIGTGSGEAFFDEVVAWARQHGIITEYCCLHPLFPKEQLPLLKYTNIRFSKNVVVIEDLPAFNETKVSRRVRRAVRDARLRCHIIKADTATTFADLYDRSMERLNAGVRWRFNLDYWEAHLKEDVGAKFFYLMEEHQPRRALLVIGHPPIAYAHFLGSDGVARDAGFDDILYFDVARCLGTQGFQRFHLGGGLTADANDPLLKFKSSFSDSLYSVGSYTRIFQPEVYDKLCEGLPQTDWFPAYRVAAASIGAK